MEIIPCTQATFLMSKREEHELTLRERFQLYVHLVICEFCRRFLKQTKWISREAYRISSTEMLSEGEKRKMQDLLNLA